MEASRYFMIWPYNARTSLLVHFLANVNRPRFKGEQIKLHLSMRGEAKSLGSYLKTL